MFGTKKRKGKGGKYIFLSSPRPDFGREKRNKLIWISKNCKNEYFSAFSKINIWKLKFVEAFLTLFFIGKISIAPWTFGSIFWLILWGIFLIYNWHYSFFLFLAILLIYPSLFLIDWYQGITKKHDDKSIVVDELIWVFFAFFISSFIEFSFPSLFLAFLFFRFFDIKKPWIIKKFDREVEWWWGVIFDDVLAWVFAWVCSAIVFLLIQVFGW